jgi:hypothetical protein
VLAAWIAVVDVTTDDATANHCAENGAEYNANVRAGAYTTIVTT